MKAKLTQIFRFESDSNWKRYLLFVLLWNPLISLIITLFLGFHQFFRQWFSSFIISSVVTTVCFFSTALVWAIQTQLSKWKGEQAKVHSKGYYYSLSMMAMPLGLYLGFKSMEWIASQFHWNYNPPNGDDVRVGLLIGTLIAGIFFFIRSRAEAKAQVIEAQMKLKDLESERLHAQISALTAQMNPHLLFNALNTVADLVQSDPQKAEDVILKLSELYRGVLNSSQKLTHSLSAEIAICEAYLSVEKARFGDRLSFKIMVAPGIDRANTLIPALCLQPLIENSIKHGIAPRASGGDVTLSIFKEENTLQMLIEDNGVGLNTIKVSDKRSTGSGIINCRERLKLHFGEKGQLEMNERQGGGTLVRLTFPQLMAQGAPVS